MKKPRTPAAKPRPRPKKKAGAKKSAARKRLEGNPGRREEAAPAAELLDAPPPPPDDLAEQARDLWLLVAPQLVELRLLSPLDLPQLRMLCEAWQQYRRLDKYDQPKHLTQETASGYRVEHPCVRLRAAAFARFQGLARLFGLSPLARGAIDVDTPPPAGQDAGQFGDARPS